MSWETNVLVPVSALSALDAVQARHGYRSRNRTIVELLHAYVQDQQHRAPDDRLMHVTTLIRHPPPPPEARARHVEPGIPLRVRLDRSLWNTACAFGFRLPGQSVRGHADYQRRCGADAVLTALARVQPLDDPAVGEHQLLTRRQAHRLWQLVIEATRTIDEWKIFDLAEATVEAREIAAARGEQGPAPDTEAELIAARLDHDVTWHGRERYRVAAALVAARLRGAGAAEFAALLDRRDEDEVWLDELGSYRGFSRGEAGDPVHMGTQGRGAATVWRAARAVRLDAMLAWIAASGRVSTPRTLALEPPGWTLRLPEDWIPTPLATTPDPTGWNEHIAAGRVLLIGHDRSRFVWPTRVTEDGTTEPVPDFEIIAREIGATDVRRAVEILLIGETDEGADLESRLRVPVPAHIAHALGLISTEQRDRYIARARRETAGKGYRELPGSDTPWRAMDHDLLFADLDQRLRDPGDREHARMAYARGRGPFTRYLRAIDHPAVTTQSFISDIGTQFVWHAPSLAALLDAGDTEEATLRWLAAARRERHRHLLYIDAAERWENGVRYAEEHAYDDEYDDELDEEHHGGIEASDTTTGNAWPPRFDRAEFEPPPF
ncbi:CopG family ribbon-helix-helix protein [Nocardia takedensis]|uniref:CopG family ribbon-helix-helix protein n=1 Tax=Nocardia takedensis TaxID=259390 RepID=UPI003F772161